MDGYADHQVQVLLSAAELIRYRDDRKTLRFTLVNGQAIEGSVRWYDAETIHIVTGERNELTLMKHAILYYQAE